MGAPDVLSTDDPCVMAQKILVAEQSVEAQTIIRSACSECKRRKQKCTRYWPCLHCGNRRVSGQCVFQTILDVKPLEERRSQLKQTVAQMKGLCCYSHELLDPLDDDSDGSDIDLEELGYSASHVATSYSGPRKERTHTTPDSVKPGCSPHLDKAIQALPSKPCLDALVDNFLNAVNFLYYVVHPEMFRREYRNWYHRACNNHIELQWTALLLMVCACSAQYPSDALRHVLEAEQGQSIHQLSEKYHTAGHKLSMTIAMGRYDIHLIQTYLHSSLWLRTKARYPECWHDLRAASQVASELDMSREEITDSLSHYHLEMWRRACVTIRAWDWQLGNIISRPLILQPDLHNTKLPAPILDPELAELGPFPGLFMSIQCELGSALSLAFGKLGPLETLDDIAKHRNIVESWAARLPPQLSLRNPDTSLDDHYPWIRVQRFNLTMMGTLSLLSPLRSSLTKPLSMSSAAENLRLQRDGTLWALRHLNRLFQFLRYAFPKDAAYHTILLFIFDTAVLLCSAVAHDMDSSMPMRESVLRAIDGSIGVMRILEPHAPIAKQSCKILNRIQDEVLRSPTADDTRRKKRRKVDLPQSQVLSDRRTDYVPELDGFWDSYDFSFTVPGGGDSHEMPVFADNGLGVGVSADVNAPPGITPQGMSGGGSFTLPRNINGSKSIASLLFSSVGSSISGDQLVAAIPSNTPMHQITKSMPVPIEDTDYGKTLASAHEGRVSESFSKYVNGDVWSKVWGFSQF